MSYLIAITSLAVLWWERNRAAVKRCSSVTEKRPCYHGITRHDADWEA